MSNIWFVGDTHFNHANLIRGSTTWKDKTDCRDFDSKEEHDKTIINNINKVVGVRDVLYHLGDFGMGNKQSVYDFRKQIKCPTIHYIIGNHDHAIKNNSILKSDDGFVNARDLFNSVNDIVDKKINGINMVLCHFPFHSWHRKHYGSIHLYAHTHCELNYHPQAMCVSIDCHPEFRPFSLTEIIHTLKTKNEENRIERSELFTPI